VHSDDPADEAARLAGKPGICDVLVADGGDLLGNDCDGKAGDWVGHHAG
jgi:hypothetical protein